jgi:hypothetical protein
VLSLLAVLDVLGKALWVISQKGTLVTDSFVVDFEDVGGKALTPSRLVVTEGAEERLDVSVQVSFEAPVVNPSPRAVGTRVHLVVLLLLLLAFDFGYISRKEILSSSLNCSHNF